jgi:glyoxylase-like metal-dependent hydrolase (beta-lactamase superfamily II)
MKTWKTKSGYRISRVLSGRSNVYLLTNGEKNILIDTSPKYMWNLLVYRLKKLNIKHIDALILTHTHKDHAENSHRIKERYSSKVIVHRYEAGYLISGDNIIPRGTNLVTKSFVILMAKYLVPRLRYKPCQYDILTDKNMDLGSYGFNAYIMHTPGHTSGSVSVIVDDEIALVGDTMFGVFKDSVFPPFADDIKQMIISWGKLLETNCSLFIPGHGSANSRKLVQKDYDLRSRKYRIKSASHL